MKHKSRRFLATCLVSVLAFTACGGDDGGDSSAPGPTQSTESTASQKPKSDPKAILRFATDDFATVALPTLDPTNYNSTGLVGFTSLMYDTMIYRTADGKYEPGLATSWKFPDAFTVELELREGVKFQDGTPLTPDAVKLAWERVMKTPTSAADPAKGMIKLGGVSAMTAVEVFGKNGVRVKLNKPSATEWRDRILTDSAAGLGVVSPGKLAQLGEAKFRQLPLSGGAGPYELVEFVPNERISLRKWDGYWNPEAQKLGGIDFVLTASGAPQITSLLSNTVDLIQATANDAAQLKSRGIEPVGIKPVNSAEWLQFCLNKAPTDQLAVRQAIAHAIDRQDLVSRVYSGFGQASWQLLSPTSPNYAGDLKDPYAYDVEKAKALLATAGVKSGTKLSLLIDNYPLNQAYGQALQSQLSKIGLDLELIVREGPPTANLKSANPNLGARFGRPGTSGGAVSLLAFVDPAGVGNWCGAQDPAILQTLNTYLDPTLSEVQTKAAYKAFEQTRLTSMPFVSTVTIDQIFGPAAKVQGLKDNRFSWPTVGWWTSLSIAA